MPKLTPDLLHDAHCDAKNWDVMQTVRPLCVMESALIHCPSMELSEAYTALIEQTSNIQLLPAFCIKFLEYCLDEADRSLTEEDYPLPQILEYVKRAGSFIPDADKKKIESLSLVDTETVTVFCKSLAFRGFAHWSDKYQAITKEAIAPEPDDYDYHWHSL